MRSTRLAIGTGPRIVPEQEPVLVDTDVASALHLERHFDRRVPSSLAGSLATRRLAVSLTTLGEAHYGAHKRNGLPLVTLNRRHFQPLTSYGLTLL
jgi:predicted nucleic acid-binding protein